MLIPLRHKTRSLIGFLNSSKKTILLMLLVATISLAFTTTVSILGNETSNFTVPSLGTVKTIGVEAYWDQNCENKTYQIDWDIIWPGLSKNVTLYIRNVSNIPTTLRLNLSDLNPVGISKYINLSWDYNGAVLNSDKTVKVMLFLSASSDESFNQYIIGNHVKDFSIDIQIVASEHI